MAELYTTSLFSDANLQGYYRFEANSNDSTANARNGTDDNTPTYTAAKYGNGLTLVRASSQSTHLPNAVFTYGTNAGAFTLWFKGSSWATENDFCCATVASGAGGICLRYLSGNIRLTKAAVTGGDLGGAWTSDTGWHHLVGTYDSSGMYIYLDNVLLASNANTANTVSTVENMYVGVYRNGGSVDGTTYFDGQIDDLGIFNRGLTAAEVAVLFNAGALAHGIQLNQAVMQASTW